ncbi:hypothetical protein DFH06DRAFT_1335710 [Mycena polygramma]|nr:hypothetical protein DFH06DRAFT_1335710 [Mycena polygramma]
MDWATSDSDDPDPTSVAGKADSRLLVRQTNLTVLATASTAFDFELLDFVGKTRLRRLAVGLGTLFKDRPIMLTHPLLSSLTHLDIFDIFDRVTTEILSDLATLLISILLVICPRLHVLVNAFSTSFHLAREGAENPPSGDDCFVVLLSEAYSADWEQGAHGGLNFWAKADLFVAKKRKSEIPESVFLLDPRAVPPLLSGSTIFA